MKTLPNGVKWLFFDMGSTLVDEREVYDHRLRDMIAGTELTFDEVDAKRAAFALLGFDGNAKVISYFGLIKTPWHTEDERLYAGAAEVLCCLKARGYRLGILANQGPGASERLDMWGIGDLFEVVVSSSEVGIAKPDSKIFETALFMAGCEAKEAAMIGDRLDNDILPAKSLGMYTVWVKSGSAALQPRHLGEGIADKIIDSLEELKALYLQMS